jgi:hypothetical protein
VNSKSLIDGSYGQGAFLTGFTRVDRSIVADQNGNVELLELLDHS